MWVAAAVLFLGAMAMQFDVRNRGDFRIYYFTGKCLRAGITPYSAANLSYVSPVRIQSPNVYPPYLLPLFVPLSLLDYNVANVLFLIVELLALATLVWVWTTALFNSRFEAPFALFLVLGFGSALVVDLTVGNVAILESLLVWIALALYMRGRTWGFAITLVVAASIKLTPLFFLWLLFLPTGKGKFRPAAFVIMMVLALHVCAYAIRPDLYRDWLLVTRNLDTRLERGSTNPAVLPLLKDLAVWVGSFIQRPVPGEIPLLLSLCVSGCVLIRTWLASARLMRKLSLQEAMPVIVSLAVLATALCIPRFKDYSYVMLLGAGFFAVKWCRRRGLALAVIVGAMLPSDSLSWTGILGTLAREYYVLVVAGALWFILAREMSERAAEPIAGADAEQARSLPEARL